MKGETFMKFLYGYMIFLGFIIFIIALTANTSTGEQIRNELGITEEDVKPPEEPETSNSELDALFTLIIMPLVWLAYFIALFFAVSSNSWIGFIITIPATALFVWALARWFRGGG
jgi:hypothetical protein